MSVLVIGAGSTIGSQLMKHLAAQNMVVHGTTRKELDLTAPLDAWPKLPKAETVFLCVGIHKLDTCEDDPEGSRLINVTRMQELARRLQAQGAFVVFFSTNQVFDGETPYVKADAPPNPRNEYGRQKAEFETWLLAQQTPTAVLRLTKVITGKLPIVSQWEQKLQAGEGIDAFTDLVFAPLPIAAVLEACEYLAQHKKPGIYQLSGLKDISYYDIACLVAKRLGADASLVRRASAKDAGIRPQFLPRHGTLDGSTLAHIKIGEFKP